MLLFVNPLRMMVFGSNILLTIVVIHVHSLNIKSYGVSDTFYASSITVFRNRAFLTLPRSSCYNNITQPTLIETHWHSDYQHVIGGRKFAFPHEKYQQWGKCNHLQDAVAVEVEVRRSRLWVLDKGTKKCPPKVIIYNLHSNTIIYTVKLDGEAMGDVTSMVVDSLGEPGGGVGTMAYIGNQNQGYVTVFSLKYKQWWTIKIVNRYKPGALITSERLILSKTEPILYLTKDNDLDLFYINLTSIRESKSFEAIMKIPEINLIYVGEKLGVSGGMIADGGGGLNYYLSRDFAVVRWDTSKPLQAEYHDVLRQSYEVLPYVPYLFNGPQNDVWALINRVPSQLCSNMTARKQFKLPENMPHIQRRVIKLFKLKKKGRLGNVLVLEKQ